MLDNKEILRLNINQASHLKNILENYFNKKKRIKTITSGWENDRKLSTPDLSMYIYTHTYMHNIIKAT